jgi:hypothetical protein
LPTWPLTSTTRSTTCTCCGKVKELCYQENKTQMCSLLHMKTPQTITTCMQLVSYQKKFINKLTFWKTVKNDGNWCITIQPCHKKKIQLLYYHECTAIIQLHRNPSVWKLYYNKGVNNENIFFTLIWNVHIQTMDDFFNQKWFKTYKSQYELELPGTFQNTALSMNNINLIKF